MGDFRVFVTTVRALTLVGLLFPSFRAGDGRAQSGPGPVSPTPGTLLEPITTQNGLPHDNVQCVLQDRRGFMWFGTDDGLARFDGSELVVFRHKPSDPTSLSFNMVAALAEDDDGMLWVGTQGGGLNRFDPSTETFTGYRHDPADPTSLSDDRIQAIHVGPDGRLWIGTGGGGLNRLDPVGGVFERVGQSENLGTDISSIVADRVGGLWLGLNGSGLSHFDPTTGRWAHYRIDFRNPRALGNPWVRSVQASMAQPGTVWVGTGGGVYAMDERTGEFTLIDSASRGSDTRAMLEDEFGVLWTGSRSVGLLDVQSGDRRTFLLTGKNGDPADTPITDLYEDRSGIVWMGTYGSGVHRFRRQREPFHLAWPVPTENTGPTPGDIWGVLEDREGAVWISARSRSGIPGTLIQVNPGSGSFRRFDYNAGTSQTLPFSNPGVLIQAASGNLWIGSGGGGFARYDPSERSFEYFRIEWAQGGLSSDLVKALLERPNEPGILWIGTEGGGLARFNTRTESFTRLRHDPHDPSSLGSDMIHALHVSPSEPDILWVGTWTAGLDRLDLRSGTITHYRHVPGDAASVSGDAIGDIESSILDPDALWIGVYGGGLSRLDLVTGRFRTYRSADGLIDDSILGLQQDRNGDLWITTAAGLSRFDPRTESFTNFDESDGLQASQFNDTAQHYGRRSGLMYFGGPGGLSVFRPDSVGRNLSGPTVRLTGLDLESQPVQIGDKGSPLPRHIDFMDEIRIPYSQRLVTLHFAALEYAAPARVRYRYRLVGRQDDWVDIGNRQRVTLSRLDPARYVFEVAAADPHGVWGPDPTTLSIRVLPPWWTSTWFRFVAFMVLATSAYGMHRLRLRRLTDQRALLEMEVSERTAEVTRQSRLVADRNRELRDRNRMIEEQSRRLLELDSMKSRFFANISHEFRTPLTLILGPIDDALEGGLGPISQHLKRRLVVMRRSAHRLHRLIEQLLDLSRLESGAMTLHRAPLDLVPLLKGLVHSFASMAERRSIALSFDSEVAGCPVLADSNRIEEIFINLLSNAFKFTPDGGRVSLSCRMVGDPDGKTGGAFEMTVHDSGSGIAARHLPYLFDRFYQVDDGSVPTGYGTGIGLSLARELVELHGGTIRVESSPGAGSSFTVRLPAHDAPALLADRTIDERDGPAARWMIDDPAHDDTVETIADPSAPTVLVVDDDPDVRAYIRDQLVEHYRVVEAADGAGGLAAAHESHPDLVISDVMMPEMDGWRFCAAVKSDPDLGHIPVVLLTALASEREKVQGLESGADDYLYKPFNSAELLARVENLIQIRTLLRDRFSHQVVAVQASEADLVPVDRAFLDQAQTAVETHMADASFSVEWLADEVALSPRQLQRRLKALTGMSAGAYIRCLRLQRAAQQLAERSGTVSEIAGRAGFRDVEYFSRLFHQVFGVLPSRYSGEAPSDDGANTARV